jgi:hypothetical protein
MRRELDYRQALALIVLAVFVASCIVWHSLPDLDTSLLWLTFIAPGLVPRRFLWIGLGASAVCISILTGLLAAGDSKGGYLSPIGTGIAAVLYAVAAIIVYRKQRVASGA